MHLTDGHQIEYGFSHGEWLGSFQAYSLELYTHLAERKQPVGFADASYPIRETVHEYIYEIASDNVLGRDEIVFDNDGFVTDEADEEISAEYELMINQNIEIVFKDVVKFWKSHHLFFFENDLYEFKKKELVNPPLKGVW